MVNDGLNALQLLRCTARIHAPRYGCESQCAGNLLLRLLASRRDWKIQKPEADAPGFLTILSAAPFNARQNFPLDAV